MPLWASGCPSDGPRSAAWEFTHIAASHRGSGGRSRGSRRKRPNRRRALSLPSSYTSEGLRLLLRKGLPQPQEQQGREPSGLSKPAGPAPSGEFPPGEAIQSRDKPLFLWPSATIRFARIPILQCAVCSICNTRRSHSLISGHCGRLPCMQHLSMTAFTCSLRREGCLMDKNRQVIWETSDDVPTVLALMAAICLWGFVASAAMIYSSTLAQWTGRIASTAG
jgi:hypothetical protein